MNNNLDVIKDLLVLDEKNQTYNLTVGKTRTFFEIIGRSRDEDLISRLLAYTLKKDKLLFGKLLAFYFKKSGRSAFAGDFSTCEITGIKCEKQMGNGRADIFVTGKDGCGNRYTLTVENKVDSAEHSQQTITYYNYIQNTCYKDCINAFLFLKPKYNFSPISCKHFYPLTYSELLELIDNTSNDIYIRDFTEHIKNYLTVDEVKFMETDAYVFQNYAKLKQIIADAETKFETFKKNLFQKLCEGNLIDGLNADHNINSRKDNKEKYTNEETDSDTLCVWTENDKLQIFRDKWYYRPDEHNAGYYFYVEMMFVGNDPKNIIFQKVGHDYSDRLWVRNFCIDSKIAFKDCGSKWTVFTPSDEDKFDSGNSDIFSPEWQKKLESFAVKKLSDLISQTDDIFLGFKDWRGKSF